MRIVEVDPDDERVGDVYGVMIHLRDHLSEDEFRRLFRDAFDEGPYRIAALYDDERCRAVAGYRIFTNLVSGKHLYVDDLVSVPDGRSKGYGKALNDYLAAKARTAGCTTIQLDSAVHRADAHRFYFRERYRISAFHFDRSLDR
ncbi:MAG: GNAT family N-acetyltransferase [Actinobacteria bacterium]|nr:GNAT family N-acetyltransferase [Actinomycetota bacterium]